MSKANLTKADLAYTIDTSKLPGSTFDESGSVWGGKKPEDDMGGDWESDATLGPIPDIQIPTWVGQGQSEDAKDHGVDEPWVVYEHLYITGEDSAGNTEIILGRSYGDSGKQVYKTTYARDQTGDPCTDNFHDPYGNDTKCPVYARYEAYCIPTHLSNGEKITKYTLFAQGKWWINADYVEPIIGSFVKQTGCAGTLQLHAHCCGNVSIEKVKCNQEEPDYESSVSDPLIQVQRRAFLRKVRLEAATLGLDFNFSNISSGTIIIPFNDPTKSEVGPTGQFSVSADLVLDTDDNDYICKENKTSTIGLRFHLIAPNWTIGDQSKTLNEDAYSCMAIELCSEIDNEFRAEVCNAESRDCMDNIIDCLKEKDGTTYCPNLSDFAGKTNVQEDHDGKLWFQCPYRSGSHSSTYFTTDNEEKIIPQ
jgi:hypothetical protein